MRVAISQPEHFPYLGYFEKMIACDVFVILDNVQFSGPRSFQNRNRFSDKYKKMQWFTVPVSKGSYFKMINEVHTAPDNGWRAKLIKKMNLNFPNYNFEKIYSSTKLVEINMKSIKLCREILEIKTPMYKSSEISAKGKKVDLVYNICKYFDATEYISGPGARAYLENTSFDDIKIKYIVPVVDNMESTIANILNSERIARTKELIKEFIQKNDCKINYDDENR